VVRTIVANPLCGVTFYGSVLQASGLSLD